MLPAFVIGLREGLETVVIIGVIAVFLRSRGRLDVLRRVWRACALAAAICAVVALVIRLVEVSLPWRPQEEFETVVGLTAVLMVTYMVVWMRRFPKDLQRDSNAAAATALERDSGRALVVLAFFAVLREGFEIGVFVVATIGMSGDNAWLATAGALLGVAVALLVGAAVVRGSTRLDVARFFRATALVLVLSAAGMVMSSASTANAAGWLPIGQTPQLDWSWLAPPGSVLSSFTTGMFGLQPYPVLIEVVAWVAYFVPMVAVVLWPRRGVRVASASHGAEPASAWHPRRPRRLGCVAVPCALVAVVAAALAYAATSPASTTAPAGATPPASARSEGGASQHSPASGGAASAATGRQAALAEPAGGPARGVRSPGGAAAAAGPVAGAARTHVLFATLDDVVCTSEQHCVAVGDFLPVDADAARGDPDGDGRATHTLVESSDGGRWTVLKSPDEGHGGARLSSVSCPTASDCVAVGYYVPGRFPLSATTAPPSYPLVESFAGRAWRIVATPPTAPNSVLASVSCSSPTACVAVGYTTTAVLRSGSAVESLLVETFDGTAWSVMSAPPPHAASSGLSSVSCPSAGSLWPSARSPSGAIRR